MTQPFRVTATTLLTTRGSTTASVEPPVPCALDDCLAELHLFGKYGQGIARLHLDEINRRELLDALGAEQSAAVDPDHDGLTRAYRGGAKYALRAVLAEVDAHVTGSGELRVSHAEVVAWIKETALKMGVEL